MRQFIRHPVDIPIEVRAGGQLSHTIHNSSNLGIRGLAFPCGRVLELGEVAEIRISFAHPSFEVEARLAWCWARDGFSELGVEFLNQDDVFKAHMVEQVCHIENYNKEVYRDEGCILSSSEAALEWINKYASGFADPVKRSEITPRCQDGLPDNP
jgi:hypothetical protein